jgi:hypothetical protein
VGEATAGNPGQERNIVAEPIQMLDVHYGPLVELSHATAMAARHLVAVRSHE